MQLCSARLLLCGLCVFYWVVLLSQGDDWYTVLLMCLLHVFHSVYQYSQLDYHGAVRYYVVCCLSFANLWVYLYHCSCFVAFCFSPPCSSYVILSLCTNTACYCLYVLIRIVSMYQWSQLDYHGAAFFDNANPENKILREKLAHEVLEKLIKWLSKLPPLSHLMSLYVHSGMSVGLVRLCCW